MYAYVCVSVYVFVNGVCVCVCACVCVGLWWMLGCGETISMMMYALVLCIREGNNMYDDVCISVMYKIGQRYV